MTRVTLQSFGAARSVTGTRHLVRAGHSRVLLDCGLFQGHRSESTERNRHVPIEADAVVLSHAHIDHSGALPSLVRGGFRGAIHATPATHDLCRAMLMDSARIHESDARHVNKHRRPNERPIEPIYTEEDAQRALDRFVGHPYGQTFEAAPGIAATFRDAGHIIGSAGVLLEVEKGPAVYFTGDLGRRMYPILRDPEPLPDVDAVLSECTYGTRDHEPSDIGELALVKELRRSLERGGKVFIPAFSVGRTQNLVYALAKHWKDGSLPRCPLFVDSPLAEKATHVMRKHPECFDEEIQAFLTEGGQPFFPGNVRYVSTREESMELNGKEGPFIVVAGSGMCEGGRIVHHLKHGLRDERNTVIFVGWCAPHTLGRRLIEGRSPVRIFRHQIDVRARVTKLNGYSAHADRSGLQQFLAPAREMDAAIYLVHGDEDTCLTFADRLREQGHERVTVPEAYATYAIQARGALAT